MGSEVSRVHLLLHLAVFPARSALFNKEGRASRRRLKRHWPTSTSSTRTGPSPHEGLEGQLVHHGRFCSRPLGPAAPGLRRRPSTGAPVSSPGRAASTRPSVRPAAEEAQEHRTSGPGTRHHPSTSGTPGGRPAGRGAESRSRPRPATRVDGHAIPHTVIPTFRMGVRRPACVTAARTTDPSRATRIQMTAVAGSTTIGR